MGTSTAYSGPGSGTPLIPSWLGSESTGGGAGEAGETVEDPGAPASPAEAPAISGTPPPAPPERAPAEPARVSGRFGGARNSFTRFAASGGSDRRSLGRAVARYVADASGGARRAAQRMGTSRAAGATVLGFLVDARARGAGEALKALHLEHLAGRPVEEVFLGVMEYACPGAGTVDEGIARDAFIETIADLAKLGITDLDALTVDQMQTVFELYAAHAIEARICNDIGMKVVTMPRSVRAAKRVQGQLRDFIRRSVADALTAARATLERLTPARVSSFVNRVYKSAFTILRTLAEAESEA